MTEESSDYDDLEEDVNKLEDSVKKSRLIALSLILIVLGVYFFWFFIFLGKPFSENTIEWSHFGDYVGGLLGPLFALLAFYWLTNSVLIQKEEMEATRNVMGVANSLSSKQCVLIRKQNGLQAINMEVTSINLELESEYNYRDLILSQMKIGSKNEGRLYNREGKAVNGIEEIQKNSQTIKDLQGKQNDLLNKSRKLSQGSNAETIDEIISNFGL